MTESAVLKKADAALPPVGQPAIPVPPTGQMSASSSAAESESSTAFPSVRGADPTNGVGVLSGLAALELPLRFEAKAGRHHPQRQRQPAKTKGA